MIHASVTGNQSKITKPWRGHRSKITNGAKLLRKLDLRTPDGKRYRDLCNAFKAEFAPAGAKEGQMTAIRLCAALTVKSESMQAAIVRGECVGEEEITRLANAQTRALKALAAMKPRAATVTMHDVLLGRSELAEIAEEINSAKAQSKGDAAPASPKTEVADPCSRPPVAPPCLDDAELRPMGEDDVA